MKTEWKDIEGTDGFYRISNNGEVLSRYVGRVLKGNTTRGYKYYSLMIKGKQKSPKAHRLVAEHFLLNPNNYPCVNHKDGNKLNNNVDNLEWCTYSYNTRHSFEKGLQKPLRGHLNPMFGKSGRGNAKSKKVKMLDKDSLCMIKEFESIELAVKYLKGNGKPKANSSSISQNCNGIRYKSAYGYVWRYDV